MAIFVPRFVRQLRDVLLTAPVDGEVLTYDSADEKWKNEAGGGGGGDLTDAVILAPASSARNRIQPTDPDAIGLTIRAPVGSFEAETWIIRIEDEFGNIRTQIDTVGDYDIRLSDDVNFPGAFKILAGAHGNPIFISQELGHLLRLFVGKKLSVLDSTNLNELFAIDEAAGTVTAGFSPFLLGDTQVAFGAGSPEGTVSAPVGSLFLRTDGGAATTLYVKESGASDTGWVAVGAGGGAPIGATYITQTPDGDLSAEQALSALATGLVKNTTGTGVLSIGAQGTDFWAPGGTDVAVADGGTGASTAAGSRTNLGVIAANVPFTPAGTIAATDVQAAIEEVASEAGGGGGVAWPRKYKTGLYYQTNQAPAGDLTKVPVLDRVEYHAFPVGEALTIDRITCGVSTAGTATAVVRLGIYNDTDGMPDTLLLDAGTVAGDSSGYKEITVSQALSAGTLYWIAVVWQVASVGAGVLRASGIGAGMEWAGQALISSDTRNCTYLQAGVTGALPSPATPTATSAVTQSPSVKVRAT